MAIRARDISASPAGSAVGMPADEERRSNGLIEFKGLFARRWLIMVAGIVLGVLGAGVVSMLVVQPQYRSSVRVLIGTCSAGSVEQAYQCGMFTKARAPSYVALATSDLLAQRVIADLRLDRSVSDVESIITATAPPEESLIEIAVTDSNASDARKIADSAAKQFVQLVAELESRIPFSERSDPFINLTVVDSPKEGWRIGSSTTAKLLLGAAAGLVIGLIAAIVRDRSDTKVRRAEQVSAAGLTVLGASPRTSNLSAEWVKHGNERVDAFRRLRLATSGHGQVVAVVGPRPGAGAAPAAVDLARASVEAGAKVVLVNAEMNADMKKGGPAIGQGVTEHGLADLLRDPDSTTAQFDGFYTWNSPAIDVLGPGCVAECFSSVTMFASGRFQRVLDRLREEFDLIIVYSAPVLDSADAIVVGVAADSVILVIEIDETTEEDVGASADMLRSAGATVLGALLITKRRSAR